MEGEVILNKIDNKVKELILSQRDAVFATVSKDGVPNIVPIHSKNIISKGTILISDQFMNKTRTNILQNSAASLTLWNDFYGCRIKGTCKYRTSGFLYKIAVRGVAKYAKKKSLKMNCKGIVLFKIKKITEIPAGMV